MNNKIMYEPGQFIKTPFGRMRVKKDAEYLPCEKCALYKPDMFDNKNCHKFGDMYNSSCAGLIGYYCYLEEV